MNNRHLLFIVSILITLLFLQSANFFYLWETPVMIWSLLTMLIIAYLCTKRKIASISLSDILLMILFFVAQIWQADLAMPIIELANSISFVLILKLPRNDRLFILNVVIWTFGAILAISLICYLLFIPLNLPSYGMVTHRGGKELINYGFMLLHPFDLRYMSLFLEPGHVAMFACFILYACEYNFRKVKTWIILVPLAFTLSLAGYIIGILGYLIYKVSTLQVGYIKKIVPYFIFVTVLWVGASNYNGGENMVNELIISRLEYDEDLGVKGNDRFHGDTDKKFIEGFADGSIILGVGDALYQKNVSLGLYGGAGYKLYFLSRGIIGVILIFLLYLCVAIRGEDKRFMIGLLLVFVLTFLQRAYPHWPSWLILFVLSTSIRSQITNSKKSKRI